MNKVILMGRLTKDIELRTAGGDGQLAVARFTIAVDRRNRKSGDNQTADFIQCVSFGKQAEVIAQYFHKGSRIGIGGHIQTGNYTNREGTKVYTTDVVVDDFEFIDSKAETDARAAAQATQQTAQQYHAPVQQAAPQYQAPVQQAAPAQQAASAQQGGFQSGAYQPQDYYQPNNAGFMNIPEGIDEELPFN